MIADYAHAARLQERHEGKFVGATTPSRFFAPGITPAMRDLLNFCDELARLRRVLNSDTAKMLASPARLNIAKVKARLGAIAKTEAQIAQCEARIAREAQQVTA